VGIILQYLLVNKNGVLKNTLGVIHFTLGVIFISFGVFEERNHKNKKDSKIFGLSENILYLCTRFYAQ
jgi:hypothetical protein